MGRLQRLVSAGEPQMFKYLNEPSAIGDSLFILVTTDSLPVSASL